MSDEKNRLVEGILDEARTKAGKIIKEAEDEARLIAEEGFEEAMKQVESEKRSFRLREHQIALREESAKRSIDRLSELKNMDTAYQLVSEEVERKIAKLAESGEISPYLVSWIVEAVVGLDKKSATVSYSVQAPVTEEMLREAEERVEKITGGSVTLTLADKKIREIGVVVTSFDGKVAYENTYSVRVRRYLKDIRKIIQEENARQNNR